MILVRLLVQHRSPGVR